MTLTYGAANTLSSMLSGPGLFTSAREMFIASRLVGETLGDHSFAGDINDRAALQAHVAKTAVFDLKPVEEEVCKKALRTLIEQGKAQATTHLFELMTAFKLEE
jgi:hypothetical protein